MHTTFWSESQRNGQSERSRQRW